MIDPTLFETALRSPAVLSTAALLLVAWLVRLFSNRSKMNLPVWELQGNDLTEELMKARDKVCK